MGKLTTARNVMLAFTSRPQWLRQEEHMDCPNAIREPGLSISSHKIYLPAVT